jgi:hypothetical protein
VSKRFTELRNFAEWGRGLLLAHAIAGRQLLDYFAPCDRPTRVGHREQFRPSPMSYLLPFLRFLRG